MRTNLTKVLGISLLAIVGILAVNASAAHATWTLLKNEKAAAGNLLNLDAELLAGELLVPGLLTIKCTGGSATAHLTGGATLEGSANASFTGCSVLSFPTCEVHSPGAPVGTIKAQGEGLGSLSGSSVSALLASGVGAFTEIVIENDLCTFNNTEEPVTGSATLLLLEAAVNTTDHLAHLNEEALKFGQKEALIDGLVGTTTTPSALAHVTEETNATWAIDHS